MIRRRVVGEEAVTSAAASMVTRRPEMISDWFAEADAEEQDLRIRQSYIYRSIN